MLVQWGCGAERRPTRHVVEITNFRFEPDTLSVAVGDTIVWVNRDVVPHTATARAAGWDSGVLAPQQSWAHVAERTGGTHYICALHPSMAGWIDVR